MIKTDTKPFVEAMVKHRALASTVVIFRSIDTLRLKPFIKFVKNVWYRGSGVQILLYRVWGGLFRVDIEVVEKDGRKVEELRMQPVVMAGMGRLAQMAGQAVRALEAALTNIDNELRTSSVPVVAIFWGLFSYGGIEKQELYSLVKFLRDAIFNVDYYRKRHAIVVFAENPEMFIDDDTLKRSIVIDIPPSTDEERRSMIQYAARLHGVELSEAELENLVAVSRGLPLHDLESALLESISRYGTIKQDVITAMKYEYVRKTGILDIEEPAHGFDAVGGYDVIKEFVKYNIIDILKNPKRAERLGLRPPRGILLFGPPGTGKTWFARAMARELGLPFMRLRTERIFSRYVGESERNIARAIEIAESVAPAVLFIDEIDRFGRRTAIDTDSGTTRRVFSIMLEWLGDERRKVIVVGATNTPEYLDEAFRRVGRFDYIVPMLYPDHRARLEILRVHTSVVRKVPLAEDVDLSEVARKTEYWTGAELEELVIRAARRAFREGSDVVAMDHFLKALRSFRINVEERQQQLEHYMQLAEKLTNDVEFLERLQQAYMVDSDRLSLLGREQ